MRLQVKLKVHILQCTLLWGTSPKLMEANGHGFRDSWLLGRTDIVKLSFSLGFISIYIRLSCHVPKSEFPVFFLQSQTTPRESLPGHRRDTHLKGSDPSL